MPSAYFNGFDVLTRDAAGTRVPLANETFNVDIVGGGSLGTVMSDDFGWIDGQSLSGASDGTELVFTHDDYPDVEFHRIADAASVDEASVRKGNAVASFILEDLATERTPVAYEITVEDLTNTDAKPQYVGNVPYGVDTELPYIAPDTRSIAVHFNPIYEEGDRKHLDFSYARSSEITAPSASGFAGGGSSEILVLDSDWTINNSASIAPVPIGVSLLAGIYKVEFDIWGAANTKSLKVALVVPTGWSTIIGQWTAFANTGGVSSSAIITSDGIPGQFSDAALDGVASPYLIRFSGTIVCPYAGDLFLDAAQRTAHASDTKILTGTSLVVTKLAAL